MADVSDPKIVEAYNDVRDDKTSTNWYVFKSFILGRQMVEEYVL